MAVARADVSEGLVSESEPQPVARSANTAVAAAIERKGRMLEPYRERPDVSRLAHRAAGLAKLGHGLSSRARPTPPTIKRFRRNRQAYRDR